MILETELMQRWDSITSVGIVKNIIVFQILRHNTLDKTYLISISFNEGI